MKILLISSLVTGAAAVPLMTRTTPTASPTPASPEPVVVSQESDEIRELMRHLEELRMRRSEIERHGEMLELKMEIEELERLENREGEMRARARDLESEREQVERRAEMLEQRLERDAEEMMADLERIEEARHSKMEELEEFEQVVWEMQARFELLQRELVTIPELMETPSGERIPNPSRLELETELQFIDSKRDEHLERVAMVRAEIESVTESEAALRAEMREIEASFHAQGHELREVARHLDREREELEHRAAYELRREELERELHRTETRHELESEKIRLELEIERTERMLEAAYEREDEDDWEGEDEEDNWEDEHAQRDRGEHEDPLVIRDDFHAARAHAAAEGKMLLVNFTGHTCVNCRKMEQFVFKKDPIRSQLAGFVEARLHSDAKDPELREEIAGLIDELAGTHAQPVYVALDPRTGKAVGRFEGATLSDPEPFGAFLHNAVRATVSEEGDPEMWQAIFELQQAVADLRREVEALKQHAERIR